ncbi:MAG: 4Fe-4S binding protein [Prevotella sp.]|nr:4Fe-4S binding protein [Prevotella sp.]
MNTLYIVSASLLLLWILGALHRNRRAKNRIIRVVEENCTGCGLCVKRCSRRVLEITVDENGKHAVLKKTDKCTACGDCIPKCKFNALEMAERIR